MGRQIRALLTMLYSTNVKAWYKKNTESNPERAEFIMQKGLNTTIVNREKRNSISAHADQIRPQVNMKRKMRKKSFRFFPLMIYWNNLYRMKRQKTKYCMFRWARMSLKTWMQIK